jgi:hypothetical protein
MFGSWYATKDQELLEGGKPEQHEYARELLAEVLERARVLGEHYYLLYSLRPSEADGDDERGLYEQALDVFLSTLPVYVGDVEEAIARARRARLVDGSQIGRTLGYIGTECVDDKLRHIGGSLTPWDETREAIAEGRAAFVPPQNPGEAPRIVVRERKKVAT